MSRVLDAGGSARKLRMVKKLFQGSFVRYLIVGITSAALEMFLLIMFVERFALSYLVANVFAFLITCIINYYLSRKWVFERTGERKRVEFMLFMFFVTCGLLISQFVMWVCVGQWHIDYRISKVIATGFVVIWNFFTRKHVVFNRLDTLKSRFSRR